VSRYDLFRRRIAPIAFALAIVFMARDACNRDERTHARIVFDFGPASQARAFDAELVVNNEQIAVFHREALSTTQPITSADFDASLPAADGELRIDIDLGGRHVRTTRHFRAEDGSTVTVPLADER
jgi:hypothetical protein